MNNLIPIIVDAVIMILAVLIVWRSAKRGFVRTAVELVGYIIAAAVAFSLSNLIADTVFTNNIRPSLVSSIEQSLTANADNGDVQDVIDNAWDKIPSVVRSLIDLSKFDKDAFAASLDSSVQDTANKAAQTVTDDVLKPIVTSSIRLITAIILFIILLLAVKLLARILNKIFNIPLLKPINKALGAVIGLFKAAVIIYILVMIIAIAMPMFNYKIGIFTTEMIDKTVIFKMLYNFNLLG